ncbi:MAG: NAD-dependent epimerase/dehydratase family protein [Sphingobacteriales bacterium]|uniref:NAD-dependent epimerase/dehydratase family protein n=1 Tax=Hydrotalea flava TaxID=714549 RepID=UPI0008360857|nr:SDR family oxidoreductase [Hydrotalea flava]RTL49092.1 MAG: NAD-dependent epimerase/dehydratase family protein [Sphingobacteriales bacterium]
MHQKVNILVVGALGFIGRHTVQYFGAQPGYQCFGCDVLPEYGLQHYWQIDATNADYKTLFAQQYFDVCINCSGAASVPDSMQHPDRDFQLNVFNVAKLLEAIRTQQPLCKFIQLSSAAVYGNPLQLPIQESDPLQPVSPYGQHKLMAETLVQEYVSFFALKACILRLFSVYGPGLKKQLFWDWHQKAKQQAEVEMWGTGHETRDFIYVDDVIQGIFCVIKNAEFNAEIYNLGGGVATTIEEAANYFAIHHQPEFKFKFNQTVRNGDPLYWKADINKIMGLGYLPLTSLSNGLLKYIEWLKEEK